jgi:alkanesulfonate monooxygenase SsuD/methylene tetrahydromethanopterin reductase-like flavin-dependent oxidoreductase (luciferase family)
VTARRGIFLAPFGELSEPGLVAELAARAEERGWDGFFLWDHVAFHRPVRAIADPWVTLAAMAVATQRIVLGPLVTPVARRRPHKLARETVTLDRLSRGRLVLGVGLGWDRTGEFDADRYGEEGDPRARARLLDEGLERLLAGRAGARCAAPRASMGCFRSTCPARRRSPSWPTRFKRSGDPAARGTSTWS